MYIFLKAFRDQNKSQLSGIASYYLKTVVMHMYIKEQNKARWDSQKNLAQLFMEVQLEYFSEIINFDNFDLGIGVIGVLLAKGRLATHL